MDGKTELMLEILCFFIAMLFFFKICEREYSYLFYKKYIFLIILSISISQYTVHGEFSFL